MAPMRAIKKTVHAIRKIAPKPRTSAKKLPIKKPHLTEDQASDLRDCFKPDGDIEQSLRSELAAEWIQGTKLAKEKMQKKITRWVYRQRHIQKRINVELGVAIENKYVRFSDTETRCLVSYFELYGDIDAGLRRELAKSWSPGTKFTEDKMFRRVSDWRKAHKKKLKAQQDKNEEECQMKDEEHDQKKGKNEKRQPLKGEEKVIEATDFEKHESNGTLPNMIQLDVLTPRDEEELLKLYREAKIVTLEKMMEWSSEINKSVHTVLSWVMKKREEVLDDSEVDMKQSVADETDLLDLSEMDDGNHQEAGEMDQVEADGSDEGVQDAIDEDVKKDNSVEKGKPDVIEIGDDDKEVIVIDDDDDRSEDDFYLAYLPLENADHTQCFINTIANILYSCEGVRDIVNNNADSKHPLCRIISDIFTGKTCSTKEWRETLKKSYHKGQQDVAEVFSYLVNNLNEEIKLDLMACTEAISTKCKACGAMEMEPRISDELHSSLSINRQDTFENFYDEKYGAKRREDCRKCGGIREKLTTLKTHGKYHFMMTYHEKMRFKSLDANQEFEMFDSKWRIRSFAEYFPAEEEQSEETVGTMEGKKQRRVMNLGRNGHYVAWVKVDDQWLRVNDNQVDQVENHLDLSEHFVNLIAFEKIED